MLASTPTDPCAVTDTTAEVHSTRGCGRGQHSLCRLLDCWWYVNGVEAVFCRRGLDLWQHFS